MTMNRRERRRTAKLGDVVEVKVGRVVLDVQPGADTSKDVCYVCGRPATAWPYPERGCAAHGVADVNGQVVLLCEACCTADRPTELVVRRYWGSPNLKVHVGGTYESVDQLRRDIADASKGTKQ